MVEEHKSLIPQAQWTMNIILRQPFNVFKAIPLFSPILFNRNLDLTNATEAHKHIVYLREEKSSSAWPRMWLEQT